MLERQQLVDSRNKRGEERQTDRAVSMFEMLVCTFACNKKTSSGPLGIAGISISWCLPRTMGPVSEILWHKIILINKH